MRKRKKGKVISRVCQVSVSHLIGTKSSKPLCACPHTEITDELQLEMEIATSSHLRIRLELRKIIVCPLEDKIIF